MCLKMQQDLIGGECTGVGELNSSYVDSVSEVSTATGLPLTRPANFN
jgi:hypothetical protein